MDLLSEMADQYHFDTTATLVFRFKLLTHFQLNPRALDEPLLHVDVLGVRRLSTASSILQIKTQSSNQHEEDPQFLPGCKTCGWLVWCLGAKKRKQGVKNVQLSHRDRQDTRDNPHGGRWLHN